MSLAQVGSIPFEARIKGSCVWPLAFFTIRELHVCAVEYMLAGVDAIWLTPPGGVLCIPVSDR